MRMAYLKAVAFAGVCVGPSGQAVEPARAGDLGRHTVPVVKLQESAWDGVGAADVDSRSCQ